MDYKETLHMSHTHGMSILCYTGGRPNSIHGHDGVSDRAGQVVIS